MPDNTKERKPNEGELPKYYVEHSHPAIIEPEEWSMVQLEMAKEQRAHQSILPFAGKLICGSCGAFFTEKHWHSTDKYHKVIWQCLDKYKGKVCNTPHLSEELPIKFAEKLWYNMVDSVIVGEKLTFKFRNGKEVVA